jgi:hypothetical protein
MEVVEETFERQLHYDAEGRASVVNERKVGSRKFEFGMTDDLITNIVGGGYTQNWQPDFFQQELGRDHPIARLYFDRRIAVDILDPNSKVAKVKRRLLHENGFGYFCIPVNFEHSMDALASLYEECKADYNAYEAKHPRPPVVQEVQVTGVDGMPKLARVRALDIRVGGGMVISDPQGQQKDVEQAQPLSMLEMRQRQLVAEFHEAIRKAVATGEPFRNPYVTKTRRKFPITYQS